MKMKKSNLQFNYPLNFQKVCINLSFFVFILIFSINIFAQRPTPTPVQEVPEVISRDDDLNNNDLDQVVETVDSETPSTTINLPKQNPPDSTENAEAISNKQKKMMMYLDLLTKTEQRAASLQKQLFDLIEKQNDLNTRIKQINYQMRPEIINSSTALIGSLRPEDLREQRKQTLELEKESVEALLQQIEGNRANLAESVRKADLLVERIRAKFDTIVDEALSEDDDF